MLNKSEPQLQNQRSNKLTDAAGKRFTYNLRPLQFTSEPTYSEVTPNTSDIGRVDFIGHASTDPRLMN